jgi:GNAT superfamily N-acetyltransferase
MAGTAFTLPDYNPRIKAIKGSLWPFGIFRLLWRKHRIKQVRIISTNVLPEYQLMGLGLVLLGSLLPKALEWGIEVGEFSWIAESNAFSRGSVEKGGAIRTKTHRLYDFNP